MPRVTVIIPSYNHARFLSECLDGVRKQTFEDWEILLIDDGSKDDSVEIARAAAVEESRLRVFVNEQNLGTYGTQQRGLDLSDSEFVAILNSDDLWAPDKLRSQVEALEHQPNAAFCYVLGWKIDPQGQIDTSEDVHLDWPRSGSQEVLPYLLYENRILASGVLFRRSGLQFDTSCRYSGDWVALLNRAQFGPAACVAERLTYWRIHGKNTSNLSVKQVLEEVRVRESIHHARDRWFLDRIPRADVARGLGMNAMNLIALYAFCGDARKARSVAGSVMRDLPDKRLAGKRAMSTLLPIEKLREHFWGAQVSDWNSIDDELARLKDPGQKPIAWQ